MTGAILRMECGRPLAFSPRKPAAKLVDSISPRKAGATLEDRLRQKQQDVTQAEHSEQAVSVEDSLRVDHIDQSVFLEDYLDFLEEQLRRLDAAGQLTGSAYEERHRELAVELQRVIADCPTLVPHSKHERIHPMLMNSQPRDAQSKATSSRSEPHSSLKPQSPGDRLLSVVDMDDGLEDLGRCDSKLSTEAPSECSSTASKESARTRRSGHWLISPKTGASDSSTTVPSRHWMLSTTARSSERREALSPKRLVLKRQVSTVSTCSSLHSR